MAVASQRILEGQLAAAEEVEQRTLEDGTQVAVYVRVIRTKFTDGIKPIAAQGV